jgi:putative aminopeptidase FrvX
MLTKARLALLQAILSQSTAPFREHHVYRYVTHCLDTAGVPWFQDPAGNLVLGVASQTEYARLLRERSDEPVRLFIAHMDHPGFHGERWLDERRLAVRWHGGSPVKHMNGAKVWIANEEDDLGEGVLSKAVKAGHGYAIDTAIVTLRWSGLPRSLLDQRPAHLCPCHRRLGWSIHHCQHCHGPG